MKIVFLAKFFDKAGTTTHMLTLGKEHIKNGHEVMLLCGRPDNEVQEKLMLQFIEVGFDVKLLKFKICDNPGGKNILQELKGYIFELPKAIQKMKEFSPDIVHVHWPVTQYIAKFYKYMYKVPYITTLHIKGAPKTILHQKPDAIIGISREVREDAFEIYNMKDSDVFTIFNGIDEEIFDIENLSQNIKKYNKDKINVLHVGTINKRKGLDLLIKACKKIEENNINIDLTILGDGDKEWLQNLAYENKFSNYKVYPFQNPQKFYLNADIFVLASRKEGFPLVPIEAMMAKVPVIRSNVEGSYDQIDNGVNGLLFKNENYEELYLNLKKLCNSKRLRMEIGNAGYEKAKKEFTAKVMARKTLNVYKDVLRRFN